MIVCEVAKEEREGEGGKTALEAKQNQWIAFDFYLNVNLFSTDGLDG